MNKKFLMGSLVSLMLILSVILCANFVAAALTATGTLVAQGAGTSTNWINVSSNQSNVKIVLTATGGDVANNITKVTVVIPTYFNLTTQTNVSITSNSSAVNDTYQYSNETNAKGYWGEAGTLITFYNWSSVWNSEKRQFFFNVTATRRASDYNATWNVTIWNSSNKGYQLLLNLGVDTYTSMVISGINVTDGTNTLFWDIDPATDLLKNLNGSAYLRNTNTTNITINAVVTNAGTSVHNVIIYSMFNQTTPNITNQKVVMTHVGNNVYQGNITSNNWTSLTDAEAGPINRKNASYINMSFFILVNDTLNVGNVNESSNSQQFFNFTFDGTYPNAPDLEMPRTTIIFAGTSVTIKCMQKGDVPYGVKSTTLILTKPDDTTLSKEVPSGSETVELIGSDIIQAGDYDVKCTSEDYVGWTQDSSTTGSFKVIYYSSGAGGGGGGAGGAGVTETKVFDADFTKLSEKEFNRNEGTTVTFSLDGTVEHKITWTKVEANSVTLTIESTPMEVKLNVGESKDVDVTGDGINDVNVKLVSINENNGDVVVTKLAGAAETPSTPSGETPSGGETTPSTTTTTTSNTTWIIIAIVVILIIIIGYFFMRKK